MKFTFTCDEGPGLIRGQGPETVRSTTFNAYQLDHILEEFELFLKALLGPYNSGGYLPE